MEGAGDTRTAAQPGATTTATPRRDVRHLPFSGTFELKAEPNGRIILPSAFRPAFAPAGGYLRVRDDHLELWTAHDFVELVDRRLARRRSATVNLSMARRALFATATQVKPDGQGRFIVPEAQRAEVAMAGDLVVVGTSQQLELWAAERWVHALAAAKAVLDLEMSTFDEWDAEEIPELPDDLS